VGGTEKLLFWGWRGRFCLGFFCLFVLLCPVGRMRICGRLWFLVGERLWGVGVPVMLGRGLEGGVSWWGGGVLGVGGYRGWVGGWAVGQL